MHPQVQHRTGFPWRRILAPFTIISICLYVLFFLNEGRHYAYEKFLHKDPPGITESMRDTVASQITQLHNVDPRLLADTLVTQLSTFDCHWYFTCYPRPAQTVNAFSFSKPCRSCQIVFSTTAQEVVPPELTFKVGGAPIPTWHTVFGAPHALLITAVKIFAAGPWAVIMFLSCTIIYFGLAIITLSRSNEDVPPFIVLIVLTVSPLGITLLANGFRWATTEAFQGINWALGLLVSVIAYSTAISLAVAIPHILKAPREIVEAAERITRA